MGISPRQGGEAARFEIFETLWRPGVGFVYLAWGGAVRPCDAQEARSVHLCSSRALAAESLLHHLRRSGLLPGFVWYPFSGGIVVCGSCAGVIAQCAETFLKSWVLRKA